MTEMSPRLKPLTLIQSVANSPASKIPHLVYGTAWKADRTADLVSKAIVNGFRGVDTACQPKHYQEHLVGQGIEEGMKATGIRREDIFIQTKFTSINGQDPNRIPYNPSSSIRDQVKQSLQTSISNLRLSTLSTLNQPSSQDTTTATTTEPYIDSLLLHSPLNTFSDTLLAWQTLSTFVPHTIRHLGISNISYPYLVKLLSHIHDKNNGKNSNDDSSSNTVAITPSIIQNRFYPDTTHDVPLRKLCRQYGIIYQSFWTLTANPEILSSRFLRNVAEKLGVEREVALYVLCIGLKNFVVLDGTKREDRMKGDLEGVEKMRLLEEREPEVVEEWMREFGEMIGEEEGERDD